ncbi:prolyl oligopeptidase family serine peptidase [Flavobacterium dauae]|uniref:S9 family peptidase n=1 Tax=Flavobacterium dauae TaxID=1563479 RepID=UPI00101CFF77|nr:prolyl oligopeptidase family serine peptidase [Flavobacterium dauae]WLD23741.1 prolyl oligopeptidase family serine peptidase [Flavobacterium dauae]
MIRLIYILFLFGIGSISCLAQHGYKETKEVTTLDKVFANGNFSSFFKSEDGKFILSVTNLRTGHSYEITEPQFNTNVSDNWFIAGTLSSAYYILNAETLQMDTLTDVRSFEFLMKEKKVLFSSKKTGEYQFWDLKSGKKEQLPSMANYHISPDERQIIYQDASKAVYCYKLATGKSHKIEISSENLMDMVWSERSDKVYFVSNISDGLQVRSYDTGSNLLTEILKIPLDQCKADFKGKKLHLYSNRWLAVGVLDNDERVTEAGPEIWLGASNGITHHIKNRKHFMPQLVLVDLKEKKVKNFFEKGVVNSFFIGTGSPFVMMYDPLKNEDFTKHHPDVDIGVYALEQNKAASIQVPTISGQLNRLVAAYNSNRLFYFKDKDWWMLDMKSNKTTNITKGLNGIFYKDYDEYCAIDCAPAGRLILTEDPDIVYLNDVFDIWKYNLKKGVAVRITSGRDQGRRYVFDLSNFDLYSHPWQYEKDFILRSDRDMILKYVDTKDYSEGISILKRNGMVEQIVDGLGHVSTIKYAGNSIVYKEEKYNIPPRIVHFNISSKKKRILHNSNLTDTLALKSRVELYRSALNTDGTGAAVIRYPVNYNPQKKYPAVVYIYEKKTPEINTYQNIFDPTGSGFNYRRYTSDGYFVIEPDIHYQIGNPGYSAAKSVNAILDEVILKYQVDKDRLGLIGHSFGGYETNFIITQTNRFKAAVSSAGISDPSSWYLTMNWNTMRSEFWRFEDQSFRIKDGLFEDTELYIANSPIFNSAKINTPLLIWTGKKDYHVNWNQSVSMFLALKRQKKVVNLLLYPEEAHVLSNFDNKVDAALKVKQWFDFYLKENKEPDWLLE